MGVLKSLVDLSIRVGLLLVAFLKWIGISVLKVFFGVIWVYAKAYNIFYGIFSFIFDIVFGGIFKILKFIFTPVVRLLRVVPLKVYIRTFLVYLFVMGCLSFVTLKIYLAEQGYIKVEPLDLFSDRQLDIFLTIVRLDVTLLFIAYIGHKILYKVLIVGESDADSKEQDNS